MYLLIGTLVKLLSVVNMSATNKIAEMVREHYGETLNQCSDIQTSNACSLNASNVPPHVKQILSMISPEITSKSVTGVKRPLPPSFVWRAWGNVSKVIAAIRREWDTFGGSG